MICSRLNAKCQRRWFFYSEVKGLSMSIHHDLTRRQFIKNLGVAGTGFTVGVALSGCSMAPSAAPVRQKPNIVFIFTDDHAVQSIGA